MSGGQISGLRGQRVYGQHGNRHGPRGSDPTQTDVFRQVEAAGSAWSSGTTYSAGDIVDDPSHIFQYQAATGAAIVNANSVPNHGIEPGVTSGWQQFWNPYASIFQNGSNAAPTIDIPNPCPAQYRISIGPPNYYDDAGALVITQHQVEIQGDLTGLLTGDIVFYLLDEYLMEYDVPYHTHDDSGIYVPCRLLSTGEFIWNVA